MLDNAQEIREALPEEVMTYDVDKWRVPNYEEIRIVIGRDSISGLSGADCAKLCGVTASNFRKYTARDGARTRQNVSFAIWHLLLVRLGVIKV